MQIAENVRVLIKKSEYFRLKIMLYCYFIIYYLFWKESRFKEHPNLCVGLTAA